MRAHVMCVAAALDAALTVGQPVRPVVAEAANISAIGNEAPIAIVVSPLYARTGMVAALAAPVGGCSGACMHLWITRDAGASWHRALATPTGGPLVVVAGPHGGDRLVVNRASDVVVSDDDGATWQVAGPSGTPVAAPQLGDDAVLMAGHGGEDYALIGDTLRTVPGSGGTAVDLTFATAVRAEGDTNPPPTLLLARDRSTGLPEVLRCDATLSCRGGAPLPGATPSGGDGMSLVSTRGVAYARSSTTLYRSDDGGSTFVALALPPNAGAHYTTIPALTLSDGPLRDVDVALLEVLDHGSAQLTAGGVFASSDRGVTWRAVGRPGVLDGGATAVAAAPGGRLFAGYVDGRGEAGMVCRDGERRWQATCGVAGTPCSAVSCAVPPPPGGGAAAADIAANTGNNASASGSARPLRRDTAMLTGGQADAGTSAVAPAAVTAGLALLGASAALNTRRRRRRRSSS